MADNFTVILLQGHFLDPEIPQALYVVDFSVNAVSSIAAIIGNALIIVALRKISLIQLHSVFKAFLFNLALADLCVGLIVQPLYISAVLMAMYGYHEASRILGALFYLANWYFPNISVFFLTAIALDRLLALHFERRYRHLVTFRRVAIALVFLWVLKLAETLIIIFDYRIFNVQANVGLGICLPLITFCYLKIYFTLRRHDISVRNTFPLQNLRGTCPTEYASARKSNFNLMRYKRTVYNMLYVYAAFVLCFLPLFCVMIVSQTRGVDRATKLVQFSGVTLIYINSSLNPLLYFWKIREIRRVVRRTLSGVFCKWNTPSFSVQANCCLFFSDFCFTTFK